MTARVSLLHGVQSTEGSIDLRAIANLRRLCHRLAPDATLRQRTGASHIFIHRGAPQVHAVCYTDRLTEAGIEPSVGSVGDSYDNALAESVIGLYKSEVIRRRGPWRTLEDVEFATLEWVAWFNNSRLLGPIGNIPPAEFEAAHHFSQQAPAMAAGVTQ